MVLPTENTLPASPVDHLNTSRLTSCSPPTPLLPSNGRQHIWAAVPSCQCRFFFLFSPPIILHCLCMFGLSVWLTVCDNLTFFPFLSSVSSPWHATSPLLLSWHNSNFPPPWKASYIQNGETERQRRRLRLRIEVCPISWKRRHQQLWLRLGAKKWSGHTQAVPNTLLSHLQNLVTLPLWLHQMLESVLKEIKRLHDIFRLLVLWSYQLEVHLCNCFNNKHSKMTIYDLSADLSCLYKLPVVYWRFKMLQCHTSDQCFQTCRPVCTVSSLFFNPNTDKAWPLTQRVLGFLSISSATWLIKK